MGKEGYIKLHRKILDWEWYDDPNTVSLFLHCLLKAEWQDTQWHGIKLEAGQFVTTLAQLSKETGQTLRQTRTALEHLKATGEVSDLRSGNNRIITVNNWSQYQVDDRPNDRPLTDLKQDERQTLRQTNDRPVTDLEDTIYPISLEEDKEVKNININNNNKYIYSASFDSFWSIYPNKKGKDRAFKCYKARLKEGFTEDQLLTACKNYADYCKRKGTEQQYIKHPSTFLSSNKDFLDYLEMPVEQDTSIKLKPKSTTQSFQSSQEGETKYGVPTATYAKIHDFPERKYDFAALEREIMGKGVDNG